MKRDLNSIENESIFLGNYEYEANAALADGMEHVDVSNTITTIKVENIDIVERDSGLHEIFTLFFGKFPNKMPILYVFS